AAAHLHAGLKALESLPEGVERDRTELALQAGLGTAVGISKGVLPPAGGPAVEGGPGLSGRGGSGPHKLLILLGVAGYCIMRTDYESAEALGTQILALDRDAKEPGAVILGQACTSTSLMFKGELVRALRGARLGSEAYRASGPLPLGRVYGFDPGVICFEWE